nr:TonB-dependent receptor [Paucibacter sp. M5-1]MCZ7883253.1 TonB-dependent receptor [Paucibacter sp. M5-1]
MSSNRWSFTRTALSAAVAIVAAAPVMAQNTTAAVSGRVTGTDGKAIAGANVSVLHRESGSASNLVTDADGRYSVRGLRVGGPYVITVAKGADKEVREDIYLALAESLSLDVSLGASKLETVVLTGSSTGGKFNSGSMGAGTSMGRQELDAYASAARSLQDYARTDPRLAQTDKDRGEISALGQNSRFNAITVDGVRINDTFGLEGNNLPTIKQPISIDAIQAVQVNISNYDVTQQGYTGANINAVTKSGTNDIKGSVYFVYRDSSLGGERYDNVRDTYSNPPNFHETTKGVTLGGPIIKDKLFFFASYEELRSDRDVPQFGPVGSSLINVNITPAQIAAVQQVAKTKYGIDIGGIPGPEELLVKDTLLKLDWNINDNHRASLRYSKTEQSQPIAPGFSSTSLSLDSRFYTTEKTIDSLVGQWFADWTDVFSTELKLSKRDYLSVPLNKSDMPEVVLNFTAPNASDRTLRFGTEETRHFNRLETETTNAYLAGNLLLDNHELKFGLDAERNEIFNAFVRRAKGQYTFTGTPATATAPAEDPIAKFLKGVPTAFRIQTPLAGKTFNDAAADMSFSNLGLFLQDTWTISKKLSVTAGVRLDRISVGSNPLANPGVAQPMTIAAATGRQAGGFGYDNSRTIDGEKLVQPRLGFNYAFESADKRKSQLRGGMGLFQGAAASVWLANPYQNTGMVVADTSCSNTGTPCSSLTYNPDPSKQPTLTGAAVPNVDIIAPGVTQPSVWKFNLAYDTELPWFGLVAGAEWVHTKVKDGLFYQHLNLGPATVTNALDGRQMFWNASGRSPNCWTAGGSSVTDGCGASAKDLRNRSYGDVTLVESTSKGGGNTLTLSLGRPVRTGFGWSVAYTRTSATEVSPLTSSTAFSNFANRAVFNPNEEVNANSAYLVRDRFNASLNWSKAFIGKYKTTVGLFYEGREGKPFSWTYGNDMNGDGISGNDLMYIPKAPGSGEVLFRLPGQSPAASGSAAEAKFWSIVDASSALSAAKGRVVSRNSAFSKFSNSFDLRISQEVPGLFAGHKGVVSLDLMNVGNFLNKRWGRIDEISFRDGSGGNVRRFVNFAGIDPATGKMIYSVADPDTYTVKQNKGESQWAAQITARYEF